MSGVTVRTLHVCYSFEPDPHGGTEVYVDALCRELLRLGVGAAVAAPGLREETYAVGELRVCRFLYRPDAPIEDLYSGDQFAASSFGRIVDAEAPDLVHQHALSPACSPRLATEAKRRGLPVVFTYHTPSATCQRGTLLEWGAATCSGTLDVRKCTGCSLDALGAGRAAGRLLALMPYAAGELIGRAGRCGGAWTALRMSSLLRRRHASLQTFFRTVDRFISLTPWVEGVLRANDVPASKIVRSPHGVALDGMPLRVRSPSDRLRLVHLGRLDPTKGTELLIHAMQTIPDAPCELDIYGVVQSAANARLMARLQSVVDGDRRVRLLPPIPPRDVPDTLCRYDMLVVPSQWMETGPLVVLEAFACGIPVLGSHLGGIAEKVTDGVDGLLVSPFNSTAAWARALRKCVERPDQVAKLANGVRPPRDMKAAAAEMRTLYLSLVGAEDWSDSRQTEAAARVVSR